MWRLYLAGSVAGSPPARCKLFQVLFAPARITTSRGRARICTHADRTVHVAHVTSSSLVGDPRGLPPPGSCGARASTSWCSIASRFPRLKLCAGWITPEVVRDLDMDLEAYPTAC